jgi:hypothetical protein
MRAQNRAVGLLAVCLVAIGAREAVSGEAQEPSHRRPRFSFGGGAVVGRPTGEFREHVDVGGGLTGHAILASPGSMFALRADASWLLYGSETLRAPLSETGGRVLVDVARTDNWIGQLAVGPQITLPSGRVRPYANAFAGVAYFSTTSEPIAPPPLATLPLFIETTHLDDTAFSYGGGGGILIPIGKGRTAIDLGVRYARNGRVSFLAEGDLVGDGSVLTPRRSRGDMIEFHVGVTTTP